MISTIREFKNTYKKKNGISVFLICYVLQVIVALSLWSFKTSIGPNYEVALVPSAVNFAAIYFGMIFSNEYVKDSSEHITSDKNLVFINAFLFNLFSQLFIFLYLFYIDKSLFSLANNILSFLLIILTSSFFAFKLTKL